MSKNVLRIPLGDLKTVRVRCNGVLKQDQMPDRPCPMVYEVDIDRLASAFVNNQCQRCGKYFGPPQAPGGNPLADLAKACQTLAGMGSQLEVEFDVPVPE